MVQKLNHSELKDITDIVYYTNLKQKNLVLRNTLVLGYTIAGTLLCWVVGASLIRVASGASVFLFLCSLICLCVVIYILICLIYIGAVFWFNPKIKMKWFKSIVPAVCCAGVCASIMVVPSFGNKVYAIFDIDTS